MTTTIHSKNVLEVPVISQTTVSMPTGNCKCWHLDVRTTDKQSLQLCAYNTLDQHEFTQGLKMAEKQAIQHWSSRLVLRHALSQYTGYMLPPDAWRFSKLSSGKLILNNKIASTRELDFSLTHVSDMAVCAIADGVSIGVDIEPVNRQVNSHLLTSTTFFSAGEIKTLRATKTSSRNALALKLWTSKEACAKAMGIGMSMNLSLIDFKLTHSGQCEIRSIDSMSNLQNWRVKQQVLLNDYHLALATVRN